MDNREFARLLLCDATELLESSGSSSAYDKYSAYKSKAEYEEMLKDELKNPNKSADDKKYIEHLQLRLKKINNALAKKKPDRVAPYYDMQPNGYIGGREAANNAKDINKIEENKDSAYSNKRWLDEELYFHSNLTNKSKKLHRKINEKGKKTQNESIAILLTEAALLLNEGIFFNKNKKSRLDKVKVDYLTKFNNPRSWNRIKNKIAYYEYTGEAFNIYPYKWRKLLGEYNNEITSIIKTVIKSNDLDKDITKILVDIGVIKNKYSKKIQDLIKEIDKNTEWKKTMSFTDDIGLFINDLYDSDLCYMYLVTTNKDFANKAKENSIVNKIDSEISSITELFYGEIISKICHAIKIAHD